MPGAYKQTQVEELAENVKYYHSDENDLGNEFLKLTLFDILDCLIQILNASVERWSMLADAGAGVPYRTLKTWTSTRVGSKRRILDSSLG